MSVRFTSDKKKKRSVNYRKPGGNRIQVLEVRARQKKEQQRRRRQFNSVACRFLLLASIVGILVLGVYLLSQKMFYANPEYALKQIDIRVDGIMTREQVLEIAAIKEGCNIFSVNIGKVRSTLEDVPGIYAVSVERNVPERLISIKITERHPVAWLAGKGKNPDVFSPTNAMLLDDKGIALRAAEMHPEYSYLPLIYGIDTSALMDGDAIKTPALQAALDLIRLSLTGDLQMQFRIRSIDLSKMYCLIVTDADHACYTFGLDDLKEQLEHLKMILQHTKNTSQTIETANLMLKRNIPVTFVPVANEEELPSKTKSKLKSKN